MNVGIESLVIATKCLLLADRIVEKQVAPPGKEAMYSSGTAC